MQFKTFNWAYKNIKVVYRLPIAERLVLQICKSPYTKRLYISISVKLTKDLKLLLLGAERDCDL